MYVLKASKQFEKEVSAENLIRLRIDEQTNSESKSKGLEVNEGEVIEEKSSLIWHSGFGQEMAASLSGDVLSCRHASTELAVSYGSMLPINQRLSLFSVEIQLSNDHRRSKRGFSRVAEKSLLCRIG